MTDTIKGTGSLLFLFAAAVVLVAALGATAHLLIEAARLGWGLVS